MSEDVNTILSSSNHEWLTYLNITQFIMPSSMGKVTLVMLCGKHASHTLGNGILGNMSHCQKQENVLVLLFHPHSQCYQALLHTMLSMTICYKSS